jgi:hypothetical protein
MSLSLSKPGGDQESFQALSAIFLYVMSTNTQNHQEKYMQQMVKKSIEILSIQTDY